MKTLAYSTTKFIKFVKSLMMQYPGDALLCYLAPTYGSFTIDNFW
jgi:hypothetical protein